MNPLYIVVPVLVIWMVIILTTNNYSAVEYVMLLFFIAGVAIAGVNYFFGIQLTTTLNDLFHTPKINVDIVDPVDSKIDDSKIDNSGRTQTYHVNGRFDYPTSRAVCKAYGAKLATLEQIEQSYDRGGEWCEYGWSEDQMVLYPTQKDSWQKYQETDDPTQCGIPGINGGYNVRPQQKLGVNCFGKKPDGIVPEKSVLPKKIDEQSDYWRQNLSVSPFNYTAWSEF